MKTIQKDWKLGTRHLFIATSLIAIIFAGVYKEPANIALATAFCILSIIGVSVLVVVSASHFQSAVRLSWQLKRLTPMVGRIKWLMIDITIATWAFVAIAIANYVLESCETTGPKWLLMGSTLLLPPAIALLIWRLGILLPKQKN